MAKNPWVDVNDRLPAHGDVVVVRLTYPCDMEEYDGHEPWFDASMYSTHAGWEVTQDMYDDRYVSHWTPIPEFKHEE